MDHDEFLQSAAAEYCFAVDANFDDPVIAVCAGDLEITIWIDDDRFVCSDLDCTYPSLDDLLDDLYAYLQRHGLAVRDVALS